MGPATACARGTGLAKQTDVGFAHNMQVLYSDNRVSIATPLRPNTPATSLGYLSFPPAHYGRDARCDRRDACTTKCYSYRRDSIGSRLAALKAG